MNNNELSVIIPCKNEIKCIGILLDSLAKQTYDMKKTKIVIADAGSTDGTIKVIEKFKNHLNIEIIKGGLPSYGRNAGAKNCQSQYVLFMDADIELKDFNTIKRAVEYIKSKNLFLAAIDILCKNPNIFDKLFYGINNIAQRLSKYTKPYVCGMFMLFERNKFEELGGFDENVKYAEDYFLSKQVERKRFGVAPGFIMATNRRFKKDGYLKIGKLFLTTALSRSSKKFYRDLKYWN